MLNGFQDNCLACRVNHGIDNPPGGVIFDDGTWRVDHRIDPGPILGWLIMKPIRHIEFLDELSDAEAGTLGLVLKRVVQALRLSLPNAPHKVYSLLFAESPDCPHIHFHIVPRLDTHPPDFHGSRIFEFSGPMIDTATIDELANNMRNRL